MYPSTVSTTNSFAQLLLYLHYCMHAYIYIYVYIVTHAPYTPSKVGLLRVGSYYFDMKSWQESL